MRRLRLRVLSALVPALALAAVTASGAAAQDQPEAPPLSRYRAALMLSLQEHNAALRLLLSGDVARPEHVALHARAVHESLAMTAVSFPEGSGGAGTRALPAIWENWDDFAARLEAARASGEALRAAAEAGDMEGTAAALREVGQSCLSCHREYRARGPIGG